MLRHAMVMDYSMMEAFIERNVPVLSRILMDPPGTITLTGINIPAARSVGSKLLPKRIPSGTECDLMLSAQTLGEFLCDAKQLPPPVETVLLESGILFIFDRPYAEVDTAAGRIQAKGETDNDYAGFIMDLIPSEQSCIGLANIQAGENGVIQATLYAVLGEEGDYTHCVDFLPPTLPPRSDINELYAQRLAHHQALCCDVVPLNKWSKSDDNQFVRRIGQQTYELVELVSLEPSGQFAVYRDTVDVAEARDDLPNILKLLESYGYAGVTDVENKYGVFADQIIAECVFESHCLISAEMICSGPEDACLLALENHVKKSQEA